MALSNLNKYGIVLSNVLAEKYKYILGLDLGDGEVTASYWKMDQVLPEPRDVKLVRKDGENKLLSGIYVYDDGKCVIGTPGQLSRYSEDKGHLYINFKVNPRRLNEGELFEGTKMPKKELVSMFATEVLKAVKELNQDFDFTGQGILAVGCPSSPDWLANGRDMQYAALLQEAANKSGLDLKVMIMPESRASLMKVYKENIRPDMREQMLKGVVIFDSGSSTFDVTYINFNTSQQHDASIPLGAALIDKKMLRNLVTDKGHTLKDIVGELQTRLQARNAKEAFYIDPEWEAKFFMELSDDTFINARINQQFMERVTDKDNITYSTEENPCVRGPWSKLHLEFLKSCRDKISLYNKGKEFEGIVMLTGGASQMQFISQNTQNVFPKARVVYDTKPSFCVSRGLSYAVHADLLSLVLIEEARNTINNGVKGNMGKLKEKMAQEVAPIAYAYVCDRLKDWVDNGANMSLAAISDDIEKGFRKTETAEDRVRHAHLCDAISKAVSDFLNDKGEKSVRSNIVNVVNSLFAKHFLGHLQEGQVAQFQLDDSAWHEVVEKVSMVNNAELSDTLMSQLDLESSVAKALKNNVLVFLLVLPIFLIASFIDGLFDSKISDTIDKAFTRDSHKTFTREERQKAYQRCLENKDKILASMKSSLTSTILTQESEKMIIDQIVSTLQPAIDKSVDNVSLYF